MNHLEDRIREVVSFMHDATAQGPLTSDADVSARGISDQILDDVSAVVNYLKENHEDVRHRLSTNGPNALKYHKLVRSQTAFVLREMRKNLAAEEVNNANDSDSSDSRSDFIESPPKSPAPKPQALSDDSIRQKKPDRDTPSAVPILREDIKASREDVKRPPAPTEDAKTAKRRRFLETVLATVDKKASINVSSSEKRFNPSPPSETKLEHHVHGVDGLAHRLRQDVVFPLQHPRIVAALGGCPTEADCVDPARIYRHPGHFLLAGPSGIGKTFLT
ncbi:MAG: uncharacterized protein KVP18_004246, partial [Porospora cf. gigantea A]|uniref:uncharacterized protein n=1 Tax=Porospora cf. gigantea A TaxID=2853593 RepID=UPI0035599E89